jgi:pyruvate/2-oxoglutarate dehydrogenase complex dihydrolipoamide dehydrogenase (E3) component
VLTGSHQGAALRAGARGGSGSSSPSPEGAERAIAFDTSCCARVGRSANTSGFGLEALGMPPPARTVAVDDFLQTRLSQHLAAGDVAGPYQFTHVAAHQAWYAAVNALFGRFWPFRPTTAWCPGAPSPTPRSRASA